MYTDTRTLQTAHFKMHSKTVMCETLNPSRLDIWDTCWFSRNSSICHVNLNQGPPCKPGALTPADDFMDDTDHV